MKIPELLAPAGGKEQYIAAVENGADAIELNYYPITSDARVDGRKVDDEFFSFIEFARNSILRIFWKSSVAPAAAIDLKQTVMS